LGVDDPRGFIARRYSDTSGGPLVEQLESCAVGEAVLKEVEGAVDDIHNSEIEWIDILVRYAFASEPAGLSPKL
jgi:hypothetical protein